MEDKAAMEQKKRPFHPSLCLLHWSIPLVHFYRNEIKYCCKTPSYPFDREDFKKLKSEYFSINSQIVSRRRAALAGQRHEDCSSCWRLEDRGVESTRSRGDFADFLYYADPSWERRFGGDAHQALEQLTVERDLSREARPRVLEIHLDNLCNMKCVYCSPYHSSLWAQEKIEYGELTKEQVLNDAPGSSAEFEDAFWEWFGGDPKDSLCSVRILGGEPLISPRFYSFADRLLEQTKFRSTEREPLNIGIVTNLNLNEVYFERLLQFIPKVVETCSLEFGLSMDCVGERAEYIRHGLNWARWQKNFERILKLGSSKVTFSLQITMSALNMSTLHELISLAKEMYEKHRVPILLRRNVVSGSEPNSPYSVPAELSEGLDRARGVIAEFLPMISDPEMKKDWAEYGNFITGIRNSHKVNMVSKNQMKDFYLWFKENDRKRKSNFIKIFPEMETHWEACRQAAEMSL